MALRRLQENVTRLKEVSLKYARRTHHDVEQSLASFTTESQAKISETLGDVQTNMTRLKNTYIAYATSVQGEAGDRLDNLAAYIREGHAKLKAHERNSSDALERMSAQTKAALAAAKEEARLARVKLGSFAQDFDLRRARITETAASLVQSSKQRLHEAKERAVRSQQTLQTHVADLVQETEEKVEAIVSNVNKILSEIEDVFERVCTILKPVVNGMKYVQEVLYVPLLTFMNGMHSYV